MKIFSNLLGFFRKTQKRPLEGYQPLAENCPSKVAAPPRNPNLFPHKEWDEEQADPLSSHEAPRIEYINLYDPMTGVARRVPVARTYPYKNVKRGDN